MLSECHRVGADLVRVSAITESIEAFGDRFISRVFSPHEIGICLEQSATAAQRFAARFAAKEATLKVLSRPDVGIDWRSIEVRRGGDGSCDMVLYGCALSIAQARGIASWSVSLSHEGEYAIAVVLAHLRQTQQHGGLEQVSE